ncbi:LPS export ABC transporter periplasmic protein LptC [Desulfurispira natronophila]|uniref:LPS export ABC transporter protein LptC n=1 Tax=Desulfurispira natronophila TaxID=682562 RepID=A0A7W7Y2R2_9BACT|nr:LPS export ABC transporter periplasmic protein LptC [Desulfurispira natronophila]MBB5020998.1 LPS export ABC transporter protein LptC [Desulfurispira natronophila]
MKYLLYLFSIGLLAYLGYVFYQHSASVPELKVTQDRDELVSWGVKLDRVDPETGKRTHTLLGDKSVHREQSIELESLQLLLYSAGVQTEELTAPLGMFFDHNQVVILPDNYEATSIDGFVLRGKNAIYDIQAQKLLSEHPFTLTGDEGFFLTGNRLEVDRENMTLRADGNIRGEWGLKP